MKKLLIIYNKIWPYRERIFELLNQKFDLTVAYNDPSFIGKKYKFKTMFLPGKTIGPFFIHQTRLHKIAKHYDAVVGLYDIRWIELMLLALIPNRQYSISFWGIGVTASYHNRFDSKKKWNFVRHFFGRMSDSLIFYSDYPIQRHLNAGIIKSKMFVAHNTTIVTSNSIITKAANNFLFVGTLYPQKGIDILLEAYCKLMEQKNDIPCLDIVGDGPELNNIKDFIIANGLENLIKLHGSIFDPEELSKYFYNAIACISPNQAGLSVLTSMGNSTIYITESDAITGGEIFNIKDQENGFIYRGGVDELCNVMKWLTENKNKVLEMSLNAKNHYDKYRTPDQMTSSIVEAINYAMKSRNGNTLS